MSTLFKIFILSGTIISSLFLTSCKKESNASYADTADCSAMIDSLNTYNNSVKSILDTYCAYSGCHDINSHKSNLIFSDYSNTVDGFNRKHVLCAIHNDRNCKPMPLKLPKLQDSLIQKLDCWVKGGMKE